VVPTIGYTGPVPNRDILPDMLSQLKQAFRAGAKVPGSSLTFTYIVNVIIDEKIEWRRLSTSGNLRPLATLSVKHLTIFCVLFLSIQLQILAAC
jgi:hypothetical protein